MIIPIRCYTCNKLINIDLLIENKTSTYLEPEWEFPKGRRNLNEKNLETAIREFSEETGIDIRNIDIDLNKTFKEIYKSYDNITYCNEYYLAKYIVDDHSFKIKQNVKEQYTEVSDIKFFTYNSVIDHIRDYCDYKKKLINEIVEYIQNQV